MPKKNTPAPRGIAWSSLSNIDCWRRVGEARGEARCCSMLAIAAPRFRRPTSKNSRRYAQLRLQYNEIDQIHNNTAKVG